MDKKRILFYIKLVVTILVSISPLIGTTWWLINKYAHTIDWQPVINGLIIVVVLVTVSGGVAFACFGINALCREVKADLRDKELKKEGLTLCRNCLGRGCSKCSHKGYLDWVQRVVGAAQTEQSPQQPGW
jgi:hypothetical protein